MHDNEDERTIDYFEEEDEISSSEAGFMRGYLSA